MSKKEYSLFSNPEYDNDWLLICFDTYDGIYGLNCGCNCERCCDVINIDVKCVYLKDLDMLLCEECYDNDDDDNYVPINVVALN